MEPFLMTERAGVVVWLRDYKRAKALEQHGVVHYVSRKMRYAILYVNADQAEDVISKVKRLPYVKSAERSYRTEIKTDYSGNQADESRFM
jgi:uncharacterized protein YlbG (UPF0298 family)